MISLSSYLSSLRFPVVFLVSDDGRETYIPVFNASCLPFDASKLNGERCDESDCLAWHWDGEGKAPWDFRSVRVHRIECSNDETTWRHAIRELPLAKD